MDVAKSRFVVVKKEEVFLIKKAIRFLKPYSFGKMKNFIDLMRFGAPIAKAVTLNAFQ